MSAAPQLGLPTWQRRAIVAAIVLVLGSLFVYREAALDQWRALYRELMASGRVRKMPVERILDVTSDLLYGAIFTNRFAGRRKRFDTQAEEIIDLVFHGILTDQERRQSA